MERTSVSRLAEMLMELTGAKLRVKRAPARAAEVRHSQADISTARQVLSYRVEVPVREGLERTVEWYRRSGIQHKRRP